MGLSCYQLTDEQDLWHTALAWYILIVFSGRAIEVRQFHLRLTSVPVTIATSSWGGEARSTHSG